jgi:hypothetical protein
MLIRTLIFSALAVVLAGVALAALPPGMEGMTDRSTQGGRTVELPEPNARPCQAACLALGSCTAWTYVEPGMKGMTPASCVLTEGPRPAPKSNGCCISGARPVAINGDSDVHPNTDLPGSDYSDFGIPSGVLSQEQEHKICSAACRIDSDCIGWTYVKRGVEAEHGRCWLKREKLPNPYADKNYTSGW